MTEHLKELIDRARTIRMTPAQQAEQRVSFAYGTAKIENENMRRETVVAAAEILDREKDKAR